MAILLDENTIALDDGSECRLEDVPPQTRIWSHWRQKVEGIWRDKKLGEVLVYDQEPVRWRKESNYEDHHWPSVGNNQDVYLIKSDSFPTSVDDALRAFIEFRDWTEDYGGNAFGTIASISWSIWRATFEKDFYSPAEWPTAIKFPVGGRLVPCKELNSAWFGEFVQWDLQAAYARELSGIRYGGKGSKWIELKETANYEEMAKSGIPIYIRAKVWIPRMEFGPLPRRRERYNPFSRVPIHYPTRSQIHGTWTFEEIRQAQLANCTVRIERVYAHIATEREYHFLPWWHAIQDGREHLQGFAKHLAKSTGNSLWGQFALRDRPRKIRWIDDDGSRKHRVIEARMVNRPGSPELSDQLTGKVRAKLYELMMLAGDYLMQANVDGAWVAASDGFRPPDGWRVKKRATMMEFIDESNYRYYEEGKTAPTYCMAGIPMDWQEKYFEADWTKIMKEGLPYAPSVS